MRALEAARLSAKYPDVEADVMPTRLGNVLRRFESAAGQQYRLPIMSVAPHLALVAPPEQVAYLDGGRTEMDLSIRLCWLSMLASACTVTLFWRTGWWIAIAAVPYGSAYLFYRGSLIMATEYGTAIATLLDLNRFRLYASMGLAPVADTAAERTQNEALARLMAWQSADLPLGAPPTNDPAAASPLSAVATEPEGLDA